MYSVQTAIFFIRTDDCCRYSIVLQVFQLFMWLWLMNFIIGLGQLTLAGAFASYYWAFDKKKDIPALPVLSSFGRSLRFVVRLLSVGKGIC